MDSPGETQKRQNKEKTAFQSGLGKDGTVFLVLGSPPPEGSSKERARDIQLEDRPTQKQREKWREDFLCLGPHLNVPVSFYVLTKFPRTKPLKPPSQAGDIPRPGRWFHSLGLQAVSPNLPD